MIVLIQIFSTRFLFGRPTEKCILDLRFLYPVISELENIVMDEDVNIHLYPNGSEQFELLESCIISGNLQQMRDKLFKDELKLWMRYNSRHDRQTKDG